MLEGLKVGMCLKIRLRTYIHVKSFQCCFERQEQKVMNGLCLLKISRRDGGNKERVRDEAAPVEIVRRLRRNMESCFGLRRVVLDESGSLPSLFLSRPTTKSILRRRRLIVSVETNEANSKDHGNQWVSARRRQPKYSIPKPSQPVPSHHRLEYTWWQPEGRGDRGVDYLNL